MKIASFHDFIIEYVLSGTVLKVVIWRGLIDSKMVKTIRFCQKCFVILFGWHVNNILKIIVYSRAYKTFHKNSLTDQK